MPKFTVTFVQEKDTKNTIKFQEVDENGQPAGAWSKIGSLYVQKTAFEKGKSPPARLTVTVEA